MALATAAKSSTGGSKACSHTGFYTKKVVPLCERHFPEASSKNAWFVQFYHPFVQKVHEARASYEEVAAAGRKLQGAKVGAVDCKENGAFCAAQGIREVPTTRIIAAGRARDFEGEHTAGPLLSFLSETLKRFKDADEALKCDAKGLFTDPMKDVALPLCTAHFPPELEPLPWIISFYEPTDHNKDKTMRKTLNKIAERYGNTPPKKVDAKNKKPLKLRVGAVDCSSKANDCGKLGIGALPTVRFYSRWAEPAEFDSFIDSDELKQFADGRLKEKPVAEKVDIVKADMPEEAGKAKEDL